MVDEDLDRALAAMAKADIFIVDDPENIDDAAFTELATYLASEFASVFGIAGEELADLKQRAALADQALRYQRTMGPTYAVLQVDYF